MPLFDPFKALEEARREAPAELSQKLSQAPAREISQQDHGLSVTLAGLAGLAGGPNAHSEISGHTYKERKKDFPFITNEIACGNGSENGGALLEFVNDHNTPAKAARPAREQLTHSEETIIPKTTAARVFAPRLREWREGFARLSPERVPCPGYRPFEWANTYGNALAFLDMFGEQAEALGWQAEALFGVHPQAGVIRVDACGAVMLSVSGPVRFVTADEIRFTSLTHRRKPGQPQGIPVWEFGR